MKWSLLRFPAGHMAFTAVSFALVGLAGCDTGNDKGATAPPPAVEGLAKTNETVAPTTATSSEDYNAQMKKQAEEQRKRPSQYPPTKK